MSKKVVVLGGGISGLAAAWRLARRDRRLKVVLLEASERVGGWIHSAHTKEGAVLELGPRSLRIAGAAGKSTLALVSDLGLQAQVLPVPPTHKGAKRRLIYTAEHGLVELPSGLSWLFQTKPPFTRPLLGAIAGEVFRKKRDSSEDESVHNFIARRLGKEIADYVVDPMCRGIFAGSAHDLSMRSCFQLIYQYELNHGSIIKGALLSKSDPLSESAPDLVRQAVKEKWQIYSLKPGLQALPDAIHSALLESGAEVALGQACTKLEFAGNKVQVETASNVYEADHVISALPSYALAGLLPSQHSPLSHHLLSIPSVTVGVVCLEYKGHVLPPEYEEAFGYLVPSHEPADILGVVFDSSTFPQHNRPDQPSTRCTVMLGGEWFSQLGTDPSTDDITRKALDSLKDHLGITDQPSHIVSRIHVNCIPQYQVGHSSKLDHIQRHIQEHRLPLSLIGFSYRGVSVNDCVHNAFLAVENIL